VHDLSDGGVAAAACEMWLASQVDDRLQSPAYLDLVPPDNCPLHAWLFGEDQGRYLLAVEDRETMGELDELFATAAAANVPLSKIGYASWDALETNRPELAILGRWPAGSAGGHSAIFTLPLARLREAHEGWLPRYMGDSV
jgi:phosphoribosylformylglycinamidine synthase